MASEMSFENVYGRRTDDDGYTWLYYNFTNEASAQVS